MNRARWSSLIEHFDPSPKYVSILSRVVDGLVSSGEVVVDRRGVYSLVIDGPAVRGVVELVAGELIVVLDDGARVALRGRRVRPGDTVLGTQTNGVFFLHEVAKPSPRAVLGQVTGYGRRLAVDPIDPHLRGRIDIVEPSKAIPGDIVEVQIVNVGERSIDGRVLSIVEGKNEADRAAQVALAAFDIPHAWPFDEKALSFDEPGRQHGREDFTAMSLVTIDGETARDFDDAVYAERRPRGGWRLVVAIADVSHYVHPFDEIDREAARRGNSVYLPDRVVPMLPPVLSDHVCSLVPGRLRFAMVCDMLISANGRLSKCRLSEGVIRSHQRLTYTAVGEFLDRRGDTIVSDDVRASLTALHEVYGALSDKRDERGAIDLDAPEAAVVVVDGEPSHVELRERHDAHRIIEEAMILANVAAARHLEKVDNVPPAYRVHQRPSEAKIKDLKDAFAIVGEELPDEPTPLELRTIAARVKAKSGIPDSIWDMILLRSMSQARYEPKRLGHFGLALPSYVHFTSPIRRYADLLVHRQLKGHKLPAEYVDVCAHISVTERRAEGAERLVSNWLKCALLEDRIGETFTGRIAGITGFGAFVELDDVYVQGLLHISNLGREHFEYVPKSMAIVASRSGMRFTVGDRVKVVLDQVSPATGRVDLRLPQRGERGRRSRRRGS